MRVSELVTTDEIKKWENGQIVTIKAGTGAGKSYFIKNILYAFAKKNNKKILMLIHRTNCANQFQMEIEKDLKTDVIDIKTYQYLEVLYKNKRNFNFAEYDYIVCDEFHYFMSDASFNKTTDISLNAILDQTNNTRIFMSATGDYMRKYIKLHRKYDTIDYSLPINYDFINTLTFYNIDSTLDIFVQQAIKHNQKTIFFIQSAKKAYELYMKYKDVAVFNCSKNNKDYYKYVDEKKINSILVNEKFEELILITTTCMDAGINIIDLNLKHIVCDVKDKSVLIQCIGRKRIQNKDDKINLYIKNIRNQSLGGMYTQIKKRREMAEYLKEHGVVKYVDKFYRENDKTHMVYDEVTKDTYTKKINELMFFKALLDLVDIELIKQYGDYAYCRYMARLLGFYDEVNHRFNYRIIEEDNMKSDLEIYLESLVGKRLFKDEQKELIDKIDLKINRIQQKSATRLNEGLKMIELPYVIIVDIDYARKLEDGTRNPNRNKTFWKVVKSLA